MGNRSNKHIRTDLPRAHDPYLSKGGRIDYTICKNCHIVYHNRRWYKDDELYNVIKNNKNVRYTICPACKKIKDNFPSGIIEISGNFLNNHKNEILNRIKNEEKKSMKINPLERIIKINDNGNEIQVTTTAEKLAQKLGRDLHRAYSGKLEFHWSKDNKFVRVRWNRED